MLCVCEKKNVDKHVAIKEKKWQREKTKVMKGVGGLINIFCYREKKIKW